MRSTLHAHKLLLTLSGRIDIAARQRLCTMIDEGLAQGYTDFIFDLHNVSFIDSSGLGALITCSSLVQKHGGHLALTRLPKRMRDLLELTRLAHFFEICEATQVE